MIRNRKCAECSNPIAVTVESNEAIICFKCLTKIGERNKGK